MRRIATFLLVALIALMGVAPAFTEDAVSSATVSITAMPAAEEHPGTGILVLYFSTDDTVKAVARVAADALQADLFEIVPEVPYTEADLAYYTNCRADREQNDSAARPGIAVWPASLANYHTLLIGYPIWHGQAPRILYTLLEGMDVSGKTIIPFCTSASSGAGSSARNLQALTDSTTEWRDVKRIDNRSTAEEIRAWELAREGLAIRMSMYGGFEQVGPIGRRLPSQDVQTTTSSGDIVLYSGDQLVVFYGSNSWAYTRLGHITDQSAEQMRELLGNGDVTITLNME